MKQHPVDQTRNWRACAHALAAAWYRNRNRLRKGAFTLLVEALPWTRTLGPLGLILAASVILAACAGSNTPIARTSASVTPASTPTGFAAPPASSPSTSPVSSPAGPAPQAETNAELLVGQVTNGGQYSVWLVAQDGMTIAQAQASSPPAAGCPNAAADVPPPVSTSNSRGYLMDAQGVVYYFGRNANGNAVSGKATTVPAPTSTSRSMFAVSPDDKRIAVVVAEFNVSGASTSLYVENLDGTGRANVIIESGAYTLWPIGWHAGNLVVAKVPACKQGDGPLCCGPQELDVIDPATGNLLYTLGGNGCVIAGAPSTAGVLCESTSGDFVVYSWTGQLLKQEPSMLATPQSQPAYLSPDGQHIADTTGTTTQVPYGGPTLAMAACGWINDTFLIGGGNVGNVETGQVGPVMGAQGQCGGRIPGGL